MLQLFLLEILYECFKELHLLLLFLHVWKPIITKHFRRTLYFFLTLLPGTDFLSPRLFPSPFFSFTFFSPVGSTSSSPALLGIRDPRSEYDRTQTSMQYYNSQGDGIAHKDMYTGKGPVRWKMKAWYIIFKLLAYQKKKSMFWMRKKHVMQRKQRGSDHIHSSNRIASKSNECYSSTYLNLSVKYFIAYYFSGYTHLSYECWQKHFTASQVITQIQQQAILAKGLSAAFLSSSFCHEA